MHLVVSALGSAIIIPKLGLLIMLLTSHWHELASQQGTLDEQTAGAGKTTHSESPEMGAAWVETTSGQIEAMHTFAAESNMKKYDVGYWRF